MAGDDKGAYRYLASISLEDFELSPFYEKGGAIRANRLFEQQLDKLLEQLNEVLVA